VVEKKLPCPGMPFTPTLKEIDILLLTFNRELNLSKQSF
jgi:hypothetical protein